MEYLPFPSNNYLKLIFEKKEKIYNIFLRYIYNIPYKTFSYLHTKKNLVIILPELSRRLLRFFMKMILY